MNIYLPLDKKCGSAFVNSLLQTRFAEYKACHDI